MGNVLFVQFMSRSRRGYWDLVNGFSDTYALCKSKGDFHWVVHEPDSSKWHDENIYTSRTLPVEKGTVYISASYINHLYQAYVWALMYPEINFVAGGPVAAAHSGAKDVWEPLYFDMRKNSVLPANLKITGLSVEQYFGVSDFSGKWWLEVPHETVPPDSPVYISYTLDNGCYWGRCIYCNIKEAPKDLFRRRTRLAYEFSAIDHPGRKIVRLNTGSMTPAYIRDVLPTLPVAEDLEYRTFMRCARAENRALEKVFAQNQKMPELTLGIGVEFPSDRMLAWMDKGIGKSDIIETLGICANHGIRVNGNIILGWDNLIQNDIDELESFLSEIPANSMTSVQLRWLYAHPRTVIHEQCAGEPIFLGPFYLGFKVEISDAARRLNQKAADLIEAWSAEKGYRIEGLANVSHKRPEAGVDEH
jgi:hypothetical protein